MKYAVFAGVLCLGAPLLAVLASSSPRLRGLLLAGLVLSTALGDAANINFVSLESYRGPDRGFEVNLTDIIALSLAGALVIGSAQRLRWLPFNSLPMALYFVLAAASTALAPQSLLASFTLFKLAKSYLVFWCVVNALESGVERRYVWYGLVSIGVLVSSLALKQKYIDHIYRIPGPFDHSNTVPLYANLVMPLLLLWSLLDRSLSRRESAVGALAALGLMGAVVATFSRAGTLFGAVALIAGVFLANRRLPSRRVRWASCFVVVAGLAGAAMSADAFLDRIRNAPESSEEARDEFNIAARAMVADHAWGVGLNNFSHVLTNEQRYRGHISVMANEEQAGVCHQVYLLTAAELGWPGLVAFLLVIGRFAWLAGWSGLRFKTLEGTLLLAIFLGMAALHASGLLEWVFRITPVWYQFLVVAGIAVGLVESARSGRGTESLPAAAMAAAPPVFSGETRRVAPWVATVSDSDATAIVLA